MIATLSGTITEKLTSYVVLEAGGVGYGLIITPETYSALSTDEAAKLYVYEHIRETAHDLYGFSDIESKDLFEQLVNVNGVGPKVAMAVLCVGSLNSVK